MNKKQMKSVKRAIAKELVLFADDGVVTQRHDDDIQKVLTEKGSPCLKLAKVAIEAWEQSRWQDIKDAPKDGAFILGSYEKNRGYDIGLIYWAKWADKPFWCVHCHKLGGITTEFPATHFQYLPR